LKNRHLKFFFFTAGMLLFILVSGLLVLQQQYKPVTAAEQEHILINIPAQSSASEIGKLLKKENLIRSELAFKIYLRQTSQAEKLLSGHYEFTRSQSIPEIVQQITQGQTSNQSFTIPEGFTIEKIGRLLVDKGIISSYSLWEQALHEKYDYSFLPAPDPEQLTPLEGYLFPDTYSVPKDSSAGDIINMMLANFGRKWTALFADEALSKDMSIEKTIIIASMIEREAQKAEERRLISGVIKNRLDDNMLLQICATVLYCTNQEKTVLTYQDLETDSPYNTYKYSGLPPGPISCPGSASIKAALEPSPHDYYFYVAKGDGSHYFSKTYQEHLEATDLYQ
jgi:UPF0755 protein